MRIEVINADLIEYAMALQLQREAWKAIRCGYLEACLIFCRHRPVITMGRSSSRANIIAADFLLHERGVSVYAVERGGDVTYHGPGQLTMYPIIDLRFFGRDIGLYLRGLEAMVIDVLGKYGITAVRTQGLSGVWVEGKKIASLGISVRHWITMHGISLNVTCDDLKGFQLIKPCGLDVQMTSIASELNESVEIAEVQARLTEAWQKQMEQSQQMHSLVGAAY